MVERRASNIEVKKINKNKIFRYIYKHKMLSNQDIAYGLGMSLPTVLQNTKDLIKQGLIQETGEFESTGGRKAKAIAPVMNARLSIGINITANQLSLVLIDLGGNLLKSIRVRKQFSNSEEYFKNIGEQVSQFIIDANINSSIILGVGVSIPGIINSSGEKIDYSHVLNISDFPCSQFSQFIPYPCVFINDANSAGIAELHNMDETKNVIYLSLNNSVGGAILLENKLYLGENQRGGEFGHMKLVPNGKKCYCGKHGCADSYCSANVLANHTNGELSIFFEKLKKKDKTILKIWEEYLSYLSVMVNNLRMVFDCDVIIGGYVGSYIADHITQLQEKESMLNSFESNGSYIKACHYKIEASALGAALLHIESFIRQI